MEDPLNLFSITILLMLAFLAALRIQAFLVKRVLNQVIERFRTNHSLCSQGAKTVAELELQPPSFLERMYKPRDYKPYALKMLIRTEAVHLSDDGKMCLLERKLKHSR